MKYTFVPLAAILALLIAPMLNSRQSQLPPEDLKYFWLAVYTYELPQGLQTEGQHTYQFNFSYTSPQPGFLDGKLRKVEVSAKAQLYEKNVLLRPGGAQALGLSGSCLVTKQVNPNQPVKFMVAWVPDVKMTQAEFAQQLKTMKATISWDGKPPVALTAQELTNSWEPLWNCQPWVNASGNGQQVGMVLP